MYITDRVMALIACRRAARARADTAFDRAERIIGAKVNWQGRLQEIEQMFRAARAFRFAGSGPFSARPYVSGSGRSWLLRGARTPW